MSKAAHRSALDTDGARLFSLPTASVTLGTAELPATKVLVEQPQTERHATERVCAKFLKRGGHTSVFVMMAGPATVAKKLLAQRTATVMERVLETLAPPPASVTADSLGQHVRLWL